MQSNNTTSGGGNQAAPESIFISISEAAALMQCSYSSAQKAVAICNARMKELGMWTLNGRTNRKALMELIGASREKPFFEGAKVK